MNESEFQKQIIDYAHHYDWTVAHFRPAMTRRTKGGKPVWVTPVSADGAGFPDLVLVRERVVYAEIKVGYKKPTAEQDTWLRLLALAGAEVYVWNPKDWDEIESVLGSIPWEKEN